MMTKEELAAKLNGRQYGEEITDKEAAEAKAAGLVVVFGYSDDNAEFRGAINEEVGCFDGDDILLLDGAIFDDTDECDCPHARAARERAMANGHTITAKWCGGPNEPDWTYETDIPHATFDVLEDDRIFCRGIVFAACDAER